MFQRFIKTNIEKSFFSGKVIMIVGARQVGKTTLKETLIKLNHLDKETMIINCDYLNEREILENGDIEFLKKYIGNKKYVFIDEAHKVNRIGETLKILVDFFKKNKQFIVSGSSRINLLDLVNESLTGRKKVFSLYPLSLEEIYPNDNYQQVYKGLESLMIYGNYPEVVIQESYDQKIEILQELHTSTLYKDIFEFQQIKNPPVLYKLLKALALQIGSEVSYNELSSLIGIDKNTIERYIDLLEKNLIIFRLNPFTGNKRKEISKLKKIFFYDTGIRNAIINNFNTLDKRSDVGALWENFLIVERLKYRDYHQIHSAAYFWRTYDGKEVDLVEERNGKLYGFEIKWSLSNIKPPDDWLNYKEASWHLINKTNLKGFVY